MMMWWSAPLSDNDGVKDRLHIVFLNVGFNSLTPRSKVFLETPVVA
jgi:hypothetical protein